MIAEKVGQEPGAVYNVGSGTQITMKDLVQTVRELTNCTAEPVWGSMVDRSWDTD